MVLFGCHETANPLNKDSGGYENVSVLELFQRPSVISLSAKLDQVEVRKRALYGKKLLQAVLTTWFQV